MDSSERGAQPSGFGVLVRGTQVALKLGDSVIGRGTDCDIVILGPHVSRRHARLSATRSGVTLVDLGSANGVFVNERRVQEPIRLRDGDRILIGTDELGFFFGVTESDGISSFATGVEVDPEDATAEGRAPPPPRAATSSARQAETVPLGDARSVLTSPSAFGIVERMLARGDAGAAARALAGQLDQALELALGGGELPQVTLDAAVRACAAVCRATGDAVWIDRCLELHLESRALLSARALDVLEPLWPAPGAECETLGHYQELVRSRLSAATPEQRALCDRVLGLGA